MDPHLTYRYPPELLEAARQKIVKQREVKAAEDAAVQQRLRAHAMKQQEQQAAAMAEMMKTRIAAAAAAAATAATAAAAAITKRASSTRCVAPHVGRRTSHAVHRGHCRCRVVFCACACV